VISVNNDKARVRQNRMQRDSWMNVLAKGAGVFSSFLLLIVLTRNLSTEDFARVTVILTWLGIATAITSFSMPMIVVRFVAEDMAAKRYSRARGVVQFSVGLTLLASILFGLVAIIAIHFGWLKVPGYTSEWHIVVVALLPVGVLLVVCSGFLQGLKHVVAAELLANTVRPICAISSLTLIWMIGQQASVSAVIHAYFFASVVSLILISLFAWRVTPTTLARSQSAFDIRLWLRTAVGFAGILIASAIHERTDILIMSFTSQPAELAIYAVAARFAQTVILAITAVGVVMAPRLVEKLEDLRNGKTREVQILVRQTAWIMVIVSSLAFISFYLLAPIFLQLLGAQYTDAYKPLLILVGSAILITAFGPALVVATFCAETTIALSSIALGIVVNATCNLLLVPELGASGAAIATSTGYLCAAITAHAWTFKRLGINTAIFPRRRMIVRMMNNTLDV